MKSFHGKMMKAAVSSQNHMTRTGEQQTAGLQTRTSAFLSFFPLVDGNLFRKNYRFANGVLSSVSFSALNEVVVVVGATGNEYYIFIFHLAIVNPIRQSLRFNVTKGNEGK